MKTVTGNTCVRHSNWIYASHISLCSDMPKHPKVVSITTGREKLAQRSPNVTNLPLHPGDLISRIECRRSASGIELRIRSLLTPILCPPTKAARKPLRPIPIRGPITEHDHNP
jgi:hypothetical protein